MKRKIQFKSLKTRLTFWFLVLALLPLLAGMTLTYFQSSQSIKKEAFNKLLAIRDLKVKELNSWLDDRHDNLLTASEDFEIRRLEKAIMKKDRNKSDIAVLENGRRILKHYLKHQPEQYSEIFILHPHSGQIVISTNKQSDGKERLNNLYFTEPLRTRQLYIKDIYYSKTEKKTVMAFSIPIFCFAQNGKHIVGVLVARVDLENSLFPLLLSQTGMGKTGETIIVNKDLTALNELRSPEHKTLILKIETEPALLASQGKTGIIESMDYRDKEVLAAYTYIPKTKWGFVSKQDQKEIYASIYSLIMNLVILFILSCVLIYFIASFLARSIAKPVMKMAEVAQKNGEGDLFARNRAQSADEFGFLAQSFNIAADFAASQIEIQKGRADIRETMATAKKLTDFRKNILRKLVEVTDSNMGAYCPRNPKNNTFERFTSIGISPGLLEPFDASVFEGEFGQALATRRISHIKNIPEDTIFKFKTFTGTILPKEIITIPVVIDDLVVSVVSLASLNAYSKESLEILNQVWGVMNMSISNLLANEATKRLAEELEGMNQELQAQTEELQTQAEELQQTSEELQEQNVELEVQSRQVEEANRLKSEFLSNMSHELRTPLNSVMALSRVLMIQAKDKLSKEEINYLEIIERNGKQLLSLINDILDLSRIEAGRMDIKPKLFSIVLTIETIMERLEPMGEEKGIDLNQEIQDNLPQIESDEQKVHKILQNLMGNAVKFTEKGHVTISARSDTDKFYIEVADTGIGMSNEDLSYIFEEFRQIDGSSARPYEGTGLGLAIAHKTAKILGGDLSVKSAPGKGSTFILTLPLKWPGPAEPLSLTTPAEITPTQKTILTANDEPEIENQHKYQDIKKPEAGTRILVVEDNEAAVIQVREVLESEGYKVDVVRGGQEALEYVKQTIPEGIILDLMMPEVDGFEVLEKIRCTRTTAQIPVLVLTAKDLTSEDLNKLSHNNIQQLIQKGDVDRQNLLFKTRLMLDAKPGVKPANQSQVPNTQCPVPKTILVIEDNPDNMITIKAVLQNKYSILEATDGEQGLKKTLEESPDLVLLDISLPEMDGFTVVRKIKENKETRHIPVIALTARVMKGDREKTIEAGCDDYIAKPIEPEKVLETIVKMLGEGKNHAENISC